jgi:hypothetical protein
MSHAVKVISNVKSPDGTPYEVPLGKNTVLIGPNEAGKSAIAESIQLARTGSAFGLLYRDKPIKDGSLLSALIPEVSNSAIVTAELDDGECCFWELERGKRPKRGGPEGGSLSVAELHAVMAGNNETKGKFFWNKICSPVPIGDLLSLVDEELHEALVLVSPLHSGAVSIPDALARLGKFQREQSSVIKAGQIALESLGSFQSVSGEELEGVGRGLSRAFLRDLIRMLYIDYRADPTIQASHVLRHLVNYMGGDEAIKRIPPTPDVQAEYAEVLLSTRLSRAANAARNGEKKARSLQDSLKALKEALLDIMFEMLDAAARNFAEAVGKFLPKGERFVFEVGADLQLRIGLERENEVHTALSGSTEARVLAAIAATLGNKDSLIVVDDRMWDADTLSKTMGVLEKADSQVVLMTTLRPKGRKRANWTYVEISRTPGHPLDVT